MFDPTKIVANNTTNELAKRILTILNTTLFSQIVFIKVVHKFLTNSIFV
jgi:hypothetical protein